VPEAVTYGHCIAATLVRPSAAMVFGAAIRAREERLAKKRVLKAPSLGVTCPTFFESTAEYSRGIQALVSTCGVGTQHCMGVNGPSWLRSLLPCMV
jgi:hypothetical protein